MVKCSFEVYNPKMGFKKYDLESPYMAVEKMADEYNEKYDLQILRGCSPVFGVRAAGSAESFKWFRATGKAIPVYNLDTVQEADLDPLYLAGLLNQQAVPLAR